MDLGRGSKGRGEVGGDYEVSLLCSCFKGRFTGVCSLRLTSSKALLPEPPALASCFSLIAWVMRGASGPTPALLLLWIVEAYAACSSAIVGLASSLGAGNGGVRVAGAADDEEREEGGIEEGGSSTLGLRRAEGAEEVAAGGGGGPGGVELKLGAELPAAGVASADGGITGASLLTMAIVTMVCVWLDVDGMVVVLVKGIAEPLIACPARRCLHVWRHSPSRSFRLPRRRFPQPPSSRHGPNTSERSLIR